DLDLIPDLSAGALDFIHEANGWPKKNGFPQGTIPPGRRGDPAGSTGTSSARRARGRDAIRELFATKFGRAEMTCIEENLLEDGEWAVLEWRDPLGLRGCGFFQVRDDQIVFQRGYFDQLSFFKQQGLPIPDAYLGS
ncbi:MAG TPA: nuclear transport factor 2 family protein, partial [Rhodothermales bacterium]|nr:nuclear transport factor 2 family protein [Rhodothermales bacterium]